MGLVWVMDAVILSAKFASHICDVLFVSYTIGAFVVVITLCVLRRHIPSGAWDPVYDGGTACAVGGAIALWVLSNDPFWGIALSLAAMTISLLPLVRVIMKDRIDEPKFPWVLATLCSLVSYLDTRSFSSVWLVILQGVVVILLYLYPPQKLAVASA